MRVFTVTGSLGDKTVSRNFEARDNKPDETYLLASSYEYLLGANGWATSLAVHDSVPRVEVRA